MGAHLIVSGVVAEKRLFAAAEECGKWRVISDTTRKSLAMPAVG